MPKIDVFGLPESRPTRAAVRFFRERRIVVRFVDLGKQPIDVAELRHFADRLGAAGLLAEPAEVAADGPGSEALANMGALAARVRADPKILRLPLIRHGVEVTAGVDEAAWKGWLERHGAGPPTPARAPRRG